MKAERVAALAAAFVVAGAVAAGLYLSGSPDEQRLLRLDERRLRDLWDISREIEQLWDATGELPATLEHVVVGGRPLSETPLDPVTSQPYEYKRMDGAGSGYMLCAVFARPSPATVRPYFWRHEAGRGCFRLMPGMDVPWP
ncbi:MAG: hypothetical protein OXF66_05105 [Gammaproteobacteria bacterium]|nr:hypothetical protein [Gammaproteobacteria bacterium]MCY4166244.1 hypothetical protein [Gammaproteobacteria bacterium]MCY4254830.1 hypothetical protein [Gammaproteobacteria bacterium]MCY4341054.1 hypothetical protein [Gammaproteobacteria bacterium]